MDKTLKKLNRMELLQLLVKAAETNEALTAENETLREQATKRSNPEEQPRRLPQAAKVGSIAEAALQANGYFEAAQRAADDYLREIKSLRDQLASRAAAVQARQQARQAQEAQEQARVQQEQQAQAQGRQAQQAREQAHQAQRLAQQGTGQITPQQQVNVQAYIKDAQTRASAILNQANAQAKMMLNQANKQANDVVGRANAQAGAIVADARARSESIVADARTKSESIVTDARAKSESIIADANRQSHAIITQANSRADSLLQATGGKAFGEHSTGPLVRRGRHVKTTGETMA